METTTLTCPVCGAENKVEMRDGLLLNCITCKHKLAVVESGQSDGDGNYHADWELETNDVFNCPNCQTPILLYRYQGSVICRGCTYSSNVKYDSSYENPRGLYNCLPPRDPFSQEGVANLLEPLIVKNGSDGIQIKGGQITDIGPIVERAKKEFGIEFNRIKLADWAAEAMLAELDNYLILSLDITDFKVISEKPLKVKVDYRVPKIVQESANSLDDTPSLKAIDEIYSLVFDGPLAASILNDLRRRKDARLNATVE